MPPLSRPEGPVPEVAEGRRLPYDRFVIPVKTGIQVFRHPSGFPIGVGNDRNATSVHIEYLDPASAGGRRARRLRRFASEGEAYRYRRIEGVGVGFLRSQALAMANEMSFRTEGRNLVVLVGDFSSYRPHGSGEALARNDSETKEIASSLQALRAGIRPPFVWLRTTPRNDRRFDPSIGSGTVYRPRGTVCRFKVYS